MNSLRKQLRVLGCPFGDKMVTLDSINDQALLICWLEDRKITELEIDERKTLQPNDPSWENNVNKYLLKLGSPFSWVKQESNSKIPESNLEALFWLVSVAINLDYEDSNENMDIEDQQAISITQNIKTASSSFGNETNDALIRKCEELGATLDLPRKQNESVVDYLRRVSLKVKLTTTLQNESTPTSELSSFQLGFTTGDKITDEVAAVLRMLYVSDFRELQNEANELIVLGQEYTANPRLNAALGKVGR